MNRTVTAYMETRSNRSDLVEIELRADVFFWEDRNYGADADGNRGSYASGHEIEEISYHLNGNEIPDGLMSVDERQVAKAAVEEAIENLDPPESYEDERADYLYDLQQERRREKD